MRSALVLLAIVAGLASPLLVHRQTTIEGRLEIGAALEIIQQKNELPIRSALRFGVTPAGFRSGDILPAVLETPDLDGPAVAALASEGRWSCVRRDVLWEGLASSDAEFFEQHLHAKVSRETKLCELAAPSREVEQNRYALIVGSAAVTLALSMLGSRLTRGRASPFPSGEGMSPSR
jgi:hypothetical protein